MSQRGGQNLRRDGGNTIAGNITPDGSGTRSLGSAPLDFLRIYARNLRPGTGQALTIEDASGNGVITIADAGNVTFAPGGGGQIIVSSSVTSKNGAIVVTASSLTTGRGLTIQSNATDSQERSLVYFWNLNIGATGCTVLTIDQRAAQRALFINMSADGVALQIATTSTTVAAIQFDQASIITTTIGSLTLNPSGNVIISAPLDISGVVNISNLGASLDVQTDANSNLITTSDERQKKIYGPVKYGLREVLGLNPILYNLKTDPEGSRVNIGFGARDVARMIPEAVGLGAEGEVLGLNSRGILAAVVNAIKELHGLIDLHSRK